MTASSEAPPVKRPRGRPRKTPPAASGIATMSDEPPQRLQSSSSAAAATSTSNRKKRKPSAKEASRATKQAKQQKQQQLKENTSNHRETAASAAAAASSSRVPSHYNTLQQLSTAERIKRLPLRKRPVIGFPMMNRKKSPQHDGIHDKKSMVVAAEDCLLAPPSQAPNNNNKNHNHHQDTSMLIVVPSSPAVKQPSKQSFWKSFEADPELLEQYRSKKQDENVPPLQAPAQREQEQEQAMMAPPPPLPSTQQPETQEGSSVWDNFQVDSDLLEQYPDEKQQEKEEPQPPQQEPAILNPSNEQQKQLPTDDDDDGGPVVLSAMDARWMALYRGLLHHIRVYRSTNVHEGVLVEGVDLKRWVARQRMAYRNCSSVLTPPKIQLLREVGVLTSQDEYGRSVKQKATARTAAKADSSSSSSQQMVFQAANKKKKASSTTVVAEQAKAVILAEESPTSTVKKIAAAANSTACPQELSALSTSHSNSHAQDNPVPDARMHVAHQESSSSSTVALPTAKTIIACSPLLASKRFRQSKQESPKLAPRSLDSVSTPAQAATADCTKQQPSPSQPPSGNELEQQSPSRSFDSASTLAAADCTKQQPSPSKRPPSGKLKQQQTSFRLLDSVSSLATAAAGNEPSPSRSVVGKLDVLLGAAASIDNQNKPVDIIDLTDDTVSPIRPPLKADMLVNVKPRQVTLNTNKFAVQQPSTPPLQRVQDQSTIPWLPDDKPKQQLPVEARNQIKKTRPAEALPLETSTSSLYPYAAAPLLSIQSKCIPTQQSESNCPLPPSLLPRLDPFTWISKDQIPNCCLFYAATGTCSYGKNCHFIHVQQQPWGQKRLEELWQRMESNAKRTHNLPFLVNRCARVIQGRDACGKTWFTAWHSTVGMSHLKQPQSIIFAEGGQNGHASEQGITWYASEKEAMVALQKTVLLTMWADSHGISQPIDPKRPSRISLDHLSKTSLSRVDTTLPSRPLVSVPCLPPDDYVPSSDMNWIKRDREKWCLAYARNGECQDSRCDGVHMFKNSFNPAHSARFFQGLPIDPLHIESSYRFLVREAKNGVKWYTAAWRDERTRFVYMVGQGPNGVQNKLGVWWYPSEQLARIALAKRLYPLLDVLFRKCE
jgi:hypothetical protein